MNNVEKIMARQADISRIKELQDEEAMILDDDLSDWWDFNESGIALCQLRLEYFDNATDRIRFNEQKNNG